MRTRIMIAAISAMSLTGVMALNAQAPQPMRPAAPPTTPALMTDDRQAPKATAGQVVTITGCLKEEKDVPGRNQSAAVRGHMDNDYVLTNVKMAEASATSGIGLATMYEIKGLDSQLKSHLNHQIEVTGTLESQDKTSTSPKADIADLHGTNVKMLAASCAAQ